MYLILWWGLIHTYLFPYRVLIFTTHTHHQQQPAAAASTSTSAASTSSAESPTAASSAADLKELRIMINISHVDLVCARTVSSPGGDGSSSGHLTGATQLNPFTLGLDKGISANKPQLIIGKNARSA